MKYALVLEQNSEFCNKTSAVLSSLGYLITPVFNPKKALHAARMIQFDMIVTCTALNPGDRRSLTGELKRCSPDAILVLLVDPASGPHFNRHCHGADAILPRPLAIETLEIVVDAALPREIAAPPSRPTCERRSRTID